MQRWPWYERRPWRPYARHDLGLALLAPLGDFGVDLLPDLGLDLARVPCITCMYPSLPHERWARHGAGRPTARTGKEGEESLCAAVDDVDLVQADRVHHLAPLLQLALRARHKLDLPPPPPTTTTTTTTVNV